MDNKIRPNILLLMADQLRYDCVGAANMMDVQTPNLDRLADEGVFFENAFTPAFSPAERQTARIRFGTTI